MGHLPRINSERGLCRIVAGRGKGLELALHSVISIA